MSENRVIGRDHALPWHLPADLQHFKGLTMGHAVIVGRKTFDSIGRPLPGRRMIVLTRNTGSPTRGVETAHDLETALARVGGDREVFVAGGAEVYRHALPRADRVYLTVVHAEIAGDAWFPELPPSEWMQESDTPHPADDRHAYRFSFRRYTRVQ